MVSGGGRATRGACVPARAESGGCVASRRAASSRDRERVSCAVLVRLDSRVGAVVKPLFSPFPSSVTYVVSIQFTLVRSFDAYTHTHTHNVYTERAGMLARQ